MLVRLSLLVRLPAPLVLGVRDALTRRLPAALTVTGVAIPMAMITIALACWSTIGSFTSDPGRIGQAAALTVSPGGLSLTQASQLISADHQVSAYYQGAQFDPLLPGENGTFVARAMGTSRSPSSSRRPSPAGGPAGCRPSPPYGRHRQAATCRC